MDWKLSLAGLLIGLLVGMTGMGGGSLMTPLLVLVFGFKPTVAIGTDIVHGAIFKSFGAVQHRRLGHVHARLAAWMLIGSVPFSLVGVALAWWLKREYGDGFEDVAKTILGAALVICGIAFVVKAYLHYKASNLPFILRPRDRVIAVCLGCVGGFVVGLTSVGSGTLFGLVMMFAFPLTAAKIVGTDIFHAAILLAAAGAGHLVVGNVDLAATGWLLIGSDPGRAPRRPHDGEAPGPGAADRPRRDPHAGRGQAARSAGGGRDRDRRRERRRAHRSRRLRALGVRAQPRADCGARRALTRPGRYDTRSVFSDGGSGQETNVRPVSR